MYQPKISPEEIEALELVAFPGKIFTVTDKGEDFRHAVEYLGSQRMIGFDTETKPIFQSRQPRPKTALLQLSGEDEAFLFRLDHIGLPQEIADIMADPSITKIGAAVADDIRGLQKHNWFEPKRFMDLQSFGGDYGIEDKSVKKMSAIILKAKISKKEQCSNWEAPELSEGQKLYAATDAWICLKMYKTLLASKKIEK